MEELILSWDDKHIEVVSISDDESYIATKELLCDFFHSLGFEYHSCTYLTKKKDVQVEIKPTFYFLSDFKIGKKICKLDIAFKYGKESVLNTTFSVYVQKNRGDILKNLWQEIRANYQQAMRIISNFPKS